MIVLVALAVAAAGGSFLFRDTAETYRPGEDMEDITRNLDRELPEGAPLPVFTDVTEEVGLGGFQSFAGARSSQLPEDMGSGAAWGDVDNDGDDDLFLVSNGGSLTRPSEEWATSDLYRNDGGTFVRDDTFPETRLLGMAAAWGDYDGDGWLDLVVSGYNALRFFHNDNGKLVPDTPIEEPSSEEYKGYWAGATWGDYDNDGDLDLYVCGYVRYKEVEDLAQRTSVQYGAAVAYTLNPSSYEPAANLLLRNDGGRFKDVAAEVGVDNTAGRSLGAIWHDFDDDGWLDLYVGNDVSDNVLFRNRGGTFEDTSLGSWVADYRGAMGLAAGDYDRDGDDDLFVTHWVGQENALYSSMWTDQQGRPKPENVEGNFTDLTFTDQAAPLGLGQIALRFVGWGTEFFDFDSDGWLDLVVVNGSTIETQDEPPRLKTQESLLLWNQHGQYFHDLADVVPPLAEKHVGRGLAVSDYDRDGDLDVLVVRHGEGARLLRNDTEQGNALTLRLRNRLASGALGNGLGARLQGTQGDVQLRRTVGGSSYLSQSSQVVHFGLGEATKIDELTITWPDGTSEVYAGLATGSAWEIEQGDGTPRLLYSFSQEDDKARILAFWEEQRAGMKALKVGNDTAAAIEHFRAALALDPTHGDARYYLANCLIVRGEVEEGLEHLAKLKEMNPQSLRAFKQWGAWRAVTARSDEDLEAARQSLLRALAINKEETGALLVLGELALLRGDLDEADQRFEWACRTNPRAVGGFFLRGYVAHRRGDASAAEDMLKKAHAARGEEWKPEGTVAEGDVLQRMHREETPLGRFWRGWDGTVDAKAFAELSEFLG